MVTSINCFCKSWLDLETVSKVSEMAHGPFVFIGYDSILQIHFLNKCMLKIKLIVLVDETTDESDARLVLKNPFTPFRGAVLTISDAPIPYIIQTEITTTEIATRRRRKRSTVTVVSVCDIIFMESQFARYHILCQQ